MRKHVVTLVFLLCATAAHTASKWPDHEWLIGSTGVAWSHPEMSGGYLHMETWFVFFGSELSVRLPLIPLFAVFFALSGFLFMVAFSSWAFEKTEPIAAYWHRTRTL